MLIGQVFIRRGVLVLRDVDGSEQTMPLDDALDLLKWLTEHQGEMKGRVARAEAKEQASRPGRKMRIP
jgi:hypothetical protein